jgi:hypothetical protein
MNLLAQRLWRLTWPYKTQQPSSHNFHKESNNG